MNWGNKICLGTAQFGNIYGITNRNKNELDVKEFKKILNIIKKK